MLESNKTSSGIILPKNHNNSSNIILPEMRLFQLNDRVTSINGEF